MKRQQGGPEGILLVDKPAGWTSHDVVAKVRRLAGQRRTGHTGTLDPAATGLLVLCLGRATRLVEYMAGHDKVYLGEITLGVTTATDDAEGEFVRRRPVPELDAALLRAIEERFSGTLSQVPPAYSAVKVGGQKAYDAARKGNPLDLKPREVTIRRLAITQHAPGRLGLEVECTAGTYIRSLARDIGEYLACGAHLSELRRIRAGYFSVADAWTLEGLAQALQRAPIDELLLPSDEAMLDFGAALVQRAEPQPVAPRATLREPQTVRLYGPDGIFLGVAMVTPGGELRPEKVFVTPAARTTREPAEASRSCSGA